MGLLSKLASVFSSIRVFASVSGLFVLAASGPSHSSEDFQQAIWASTNHAIHSLGADSGELLIDAVHDPQARAIEVDLRRGGVWAYGQGRMTRHGLDGSVELDVDVPGTSPSSSANGNGTGNGGERLQDLEVAPESGEVWLAVKSELYRYSREGELLEQWSLDVDARGLAIAPEASGVWLLTRDALYHVSPGVEIPAPTELPSDTPWIEMSAGADGVLWLAGQNHLYRLNGEGEATVSLAVDAIRQVAAGEAGGAWYADNKTLVRVDGEGSETARFDHSARARTVDLELDPSDGTPWLATQTDIVHFDAEGAEIIAVPVKTLGASARLWDIEPGIDATSPQLTFISPESGACLGTAQPSLAFTYSDIESGINPASLTLYHRDATLPADCETGAESATCAPIESLPEGDQTIDARIADWAGNLSEPASRTVHIDTTAPVISIASPADGAETFDGQITMTGQVDEPVPLMVNGEAVEFDESLQFSIEVGLEFGDNAFAFEATDCARNSSTRTLTVTRKRSPPVFTSTPVTEVMATETYRYDSDATDLDSDDILEYSLVSGPEGFTIESSTGLMEWATTEEDVGDHSVTIQVTDLNGDLDEQVFEVTVQPIEQSDELSITSDPIKSLVLPSSDPEVSEINAIIRDFRDSHSDFEGRAGSYTPGLVASELDEDGKPAFIADNNTGRIASSDSFRQWYRDVPGINMPKSFSVKLLRDQDTGLFNFGSSSFFPIDGELFGNQRRAHNFHFTLEAHTSFTYQGGEIFEFVGDDDLWVFIDGRLALDLGGMHSRLAGNIRLDELGLDPGQAYPMDIFYAERHTVASNFNISTSLDIAPSAIYEYQVLVDAPEFARLLYSLIQGPEGMEIGSESGLLNWVATTDEIGTHKVVIKVESDSGSEVTQEYDLVVEPPNRAPIVETTPNAVSAVERKYSYKVEALDPDGDEVAYALTASPTGMSIDGAGLITWTPTTDQVGEHTVTVEVSDRRGGVATQSYTLTVNEAGGTNQLPGITSAPPLTARSGQAYSYQVEASDPDGDALGYTLAEAPAGMSISASDGRVEWTPSAVDVGEHVVVIEVRDGRGGLARQDYTLSVVDGSVNNPPQILSAPPTDGKAGFEYRYAVVAEDPEGDPINFTLIDGPAGMTVDASGEVLWTPDSAGDFPVTVRADDGQAYQQQTWTITVASSDTELAVNVVADPAFVDPGEPVTITVEASGMAGQYSLIANLDGEPLALDEANQAVVTLDEIGAHQVTAALSDDYGSVTDSTSFTVRDPNANPPPVVKLTEPGFNQEVTKPVDIVGSVDDDNLESWVLAIRPRNNAEAQPQVLAEGNATFAEQTIAPFDPTQLTNGLYSVILQATDLSGQTEFDSRVVRVTGDLKVGNFSITFEDVSIPLAGIPVRVTRTYDSRRRFESLDFGQGWSVDYQNGRVQESRTVGFGWDLYEYDRGLITEWCVQPNGAPVVTVNLGDGDLRTFEAKAQPECQEFVPQVDVNIVFEPVDGTDATLEMTDYGLVRLVEGNIVDLGAPEEPIDPDHYRLTTADGMVYQLDQAFGVRKVIEPAGNEITFSKAGITHSSGVGVDFVRDTQGRISEILLPDGESLSYEYDANGDLVGMTDQVGQAAGYTYDANFPHYLRDIVDPRGVRVTRNEYDADGRLVATIDADGNRIEYEHDIEGQREFIRDRRGNLMTFVYDDQGRVLAETNALGETTTHTYNAEGFELTRTDPLGNTTEWTYDEHGNKLTETNPLGETTAMAYNAHNRLLSVTAPNGTVAMTNTYDPNSLDLTSTTDALGNTTTFTFDVGFGSGQTGQLLATTDALGNETTYEYSFGGNYLEREVDPLGTATRYVRDDMGRVLEESTTRTLPDGTVQELLTTNTYDAKGRRIQTTRPDGSTTKTTFNAIGKVAERCDARGNCTRYTYDDQGRRVQTTHTDGTTETVTYDAAGNEVARTDRAGRTTRMVYDAADRLIETIYPDDTPTDDSDNTRETRDYDAAGRLVAVTDERGNTTTYEYDAAGRRTAVIDPLGNRTDFILDGRGRQVAVMDADGHVTRYEYDDAGRRTATIFADDTPSDDTDNSRVTTAYDALGRKIAETDEVGQTKRFVYDALGRLTEVIEPDPETGVTPLRAEPGGIRTRYTYDEQGNKLTQTDALGRTTRWTYDELGRVTSRELPLGQVETFDYDAAGNRVSKTDFKSQTTTYDYDVMDRRIGIHAADREVALSYTATGLKQQVTVQPGSTGLQVGTTTWTYDARDRLAEIQYPDGQGIRYEYDAAGNRTALTTATGTTSYTFDALNRLRSVTAPETGTTTYTYNAAGDLIRVAHPNGTEQVDTFDARHRLTDRVNQRTDGTVVTEHHYTLSDDNRRLALQEADGRITEWTYDALDRLVDERVTDAVRGDRVTTFEYDAVGNRTRRETTCDPEPCGGELMAGVTTYTYDDNDRLLTETGPNGATTYGWDANGNQVEKSAPDGLTIYDYNTDNRLVGAETPDHSLEFKYDMNGIRQSRTEDGVITDYVTDSNRPYTQVIEELDGAGAIQSSYVHGHDLLSQSRSGMASFYHTDGLGSTRALSDAGGIETDQYGYTAYGKLAYGNGATDNRYRYTGEQLDLVLGEYYLRARYYQSGIGRFIRRDEFQGSPRSPKSLNKYSYSVNNPTNRVDPSGKVSVGQLAMTAGIAGVLTNTAITGYTIGTLISNGQVSPDGVMASIRVTGNYGFGGGFGLDAVFDLNTNNLWLFGTGELTIAPLTVFSPQRKIDASGSAGLIWGMNSPEEFTGIGPNFAGSWPISTAHLLARAAPIQAAPKGSFWGFMTQTAQFAKRNRGWSIKFGFAGGLIEPNPAFVMIGPGSSFETEIFGMTGTIVNSGEVATTVREAISGIDGYDPFDLKDLINRLKKPYLR